MAYRRVNPSTATARFSLIDSSAARPMTTAFSPSSTVTSTGSPSITARRNLVLEVSGAVVLAGLQHVLVDLYRAADEAFQLPRAYDDLRTCGPGAPGQNRGAAGTKHSALPLSPTAAISSCQNEPSANMQRSSRGRAPDRKSTSA